MNRLQARVCDNVSGGWAEVESVSLGDRVVDEPKWFVTVTEIATPMAEHPRLRIDLHAVDEYTLRVEALIWQSFVAVGYGYRFYLIPIDTPKSVVKHSLGGNLNYFSRFHPADTILLVLSGEKIVCVTMAGDISWEATVAVDGVEIREVKETVIVGQSCEDPPDIWSDFEISLSDGSILKKGPPKRRYK